jgi:hypothetical protein
VEWDVGRCHRVVNIHVVCADKEWEEIAYNVTNAKVGFTKGVVESRES